MVSRLLLLIAAPSLLLAQTTEPDPWRTQDGRLAPLLENIGKLEFPVSTQDPVAQRFFNQALTLHYAFNHAEAIRSFREAARIDPKLAMAHWGVALSSGPNINDPVPGPEREAESYAAIRRAQALASNATPKEQALIRALAARYAAKKPNREALNQAWLKAMEPVYAEYGDDADVATLYAASVMNTSPWDYWESGEVAKADAAKAIGALEKGIAAHPDHAGLLHYYIHIVEASDDPDRAEKSADMLGGLVPVAGHLVHMPSHIFIRIGRYADAAEANVKAVKSDEDYVTQCRNQGIYPVGYYPHNIHFLWAALMLEGRSREAFETAEKAAHSQHEPKLHKNNFAQLLRSIPVVTQVRFGRWDDVLAAPEPDKQWLHARAMRHFARGMALRSKGDVAAASVELKRLRKVSRKKLFRFGPGQERNPFGLSAQTAAGILEGELAAAEGRYDDAVRALEKAAATEDRFIYNEPEEWQLPARQSLGEVLLSAGRPADAEKVFRDELREHRENGWSLTGLIKALEAQSKTTEAAEVRKRFERAWERADVEIAAARF